MVLDPACQHAFSTGAFLRQALLLQQMSGLETSVSLVFSCSSLALSGSARPECGPPFASRVPIDGCSAGLTAAVIDETLGGLIYMLKRDGSLPPGPAFTVHLEVDYKAVSCTSSLDLDCHVVCHSIIHSVRINICSRSSTACAVIGS